MRGLRVAHSAFCERLNYLPTAIPLLVSARERDSSFGIGDGSIDVLQGTETPAAFVVLRYCELGAGRA